MIPSRPPIQRIKDSTSATWMVGDFGVVAKTIFAGAEALVTCLAIPFCAHMLDVAYITGNVAIPLAHQGAFVTSIDIAPISSPMLANGPPPKTSTRPSTKAMPNVPSQGFSSPP